VQWPARNGAPLISAPSPSFLHSAALRYVTSATADTAPALRCARQAAGLASTAAKPRQSLCLVPWRRVGDPAPVGRPAARAPACPLRRARPGPHGPALAVNRAARLRLLSRAVTEPIRPGKAPARTPPVPLRSMGCASPSPTVPACGAPVPAPETPRPCGRCASRCSLRPRLALSASLRSRTARPALTLRPVVRRLARRANPNQQLGRKPFVVVMATMTPDQVAALNGAGLPFLR